MAPSLLATSFCLAASVVLPTLPEAELDDTEVVTNAALPGVHFDSRLFAFSLELNATSSNNVEVAFGHDTDHDGMLSRGEIGLLVGWDCGEWKAVDYATGNEAVEQGTEGCVSFDWRLEFGAVDVPRSLAVNIDGRVAFAELAANLPRFLYSPEWDTVRVVCRGMGSPHPSIICSIENNPLAIKIR